MNNDSDQCLSNFYSFYNEQPNQKSDLDLFSLCSFNQNSQDEPKNNINGSTFSLSPQCINENDSLEGEDDNQIYYINKAIKNISQSPKKNNEFYISNNIQSNENHSNKLNLFQVTKVDDSNYKNDCDFQLSRKKRKRNDKNETKKHDKNSLDNMLRKIQVSYINFILLFINFLVSKYLNIDKNIEIPKFLKLDYNFKKNVTKKKVNELKSKTINDLISMTNISNKYKKYDKCKNKITLEKLTKYSEIMKKLFQKNYLFLFNIFRQKERKVNLNIVGLQNEIIEIPDDIKLYEDIFRKKNNDDEEYRKNMEKTVNEFYKANCIYFRKFKISI